MANLVYKDCLIRIFAIHDEISKNWIPVADITWETDADRRSHTLTSLPAPFKNWPDAEKYMLELAKAWIDGGA
jgi:hypothetical protein